MNIRLAFLVLPFWVLLMSCEPDREQTKPNIVFILADDMGYNELSCYGQGHFRTPNIDKLAEEGMRFTDFYAGNTVCGPSRCSLITGRHPGNASIRGNIGVYDTSPITLDKIGINAEDKTIAEILKERGYATALTGKWHLEYPSDTLNSWPEHRGFDYVLRERWGGEISKRRKDHFDRTEEFFDHNYPYELWENGEKIVIHENKGGSRGRLMDDLVTDAGINFIEQHQEQPFFILFSMKIPHIPETLVEDTTSFKDKNWPECERTHAARIVYLDNLVEKILLKLRELDLDENTMVIFSSDNGGQNEGGLYHPAMDPCKHDKDFFKSNYPFRGHKRDLYEGGLRVPLIVKWPGHVSPGLVSDHVGAFWDVLPTLAAATGLAETNYPHDGISFMPELLGQVQPEHDHLYWEFTYAGHLKDTVDYGFLQALRKDSLKAVRYGISQPIEIYDITKDPGETNDLSIHMPAVVNLVDSLFQHSRKPSERYPYGGGISMDQESELVMLGY